MAAHLAEPGHQELTLQMLVDVKTKVATTVLPGSEALWVIPNVAANIALANSQECTTEVVFGLPAASPLRTAAHPLHTRFASALGASVSEAAMRPDPRSSPAGTRSDRSGASSPGRHCRSTLPLAVSGWHSLGVHALILLPSRLFDAEVTVPPS